MLQAANPSGVTITVVTPSFNHRGFIESTMQSVIGQQGDFYIDYIVMDGGSKDGTRELLKEYEQKFNAGQIPMACKGIRFRWQSEPDQGQAHAVNKGFALAEGSILCWLNSDDLYYNSEVLAKVVRYFETHPESRFVYGKGYAINTNGKVIREEHYVTDFGGEDLLEIDYVLQPSAFWRYDVYESVGPLKQSMHFAFDWEYWIRCQRQFSLDFMNEFLSCNRIHPTTKTTCGGIVRKREIAELLLTQGKFTERSVQAYLATPLFESAPAAASPAQTDASVMPYPNSVSPLMGPLRRVLRYCLAPTRMAEQKLRQIRKRRRYEREMHQSKRL